MLIGETLIAVRPSRLIIPAAITMVAQMMQDIYAKQFAAEDPQRYSLDSPLVLFAFIKVVAIVVLAVHAARILIGGTRNAADDGPKGAARADKYLLYIVGLNVAIASILLVAVQFINSDSYVPLAEAGVTKQVAKVILIALVLTAALPLNKRMLHDISAAIGSRTGSASEPRPGAEANKRFTRRLGFNLAKYVLPVYLAHLCLTFGLSKSGGMSYAQAAADAALVVMYGLLAGYAIFRSHEEAIIEVR